LVNTFKEKVKHELEFENLVGKSLELMEEIAVKLKVKDYKLYKAEENINTDGPEKNTNDDSGEEGNKNYTTSDA
jgi:hypothetical protein